MSAPAPLRLVPLSAMPEVGRGDDLAALIADAARAAGVELRDGIVVVAQKVVSKAEGRVVALASVVPSEHALRIAAEDDKDARQVELVLRETTRIVKRGNGVLICETRHGLVCANAGVDLSNAPGPEMAVLLPEDPDASAVRIREGLLAGGAHNVAVIVSDTFGRPWREALVDVAIGSSGIAPIDDVRGRSDRSGRELVVTAMASIDQLATAAGLLMLKDAGVAVVWIEGIVPRGDGSARELVRDPASDLFR